MPTMCATVLPHLFRRYWSVQFGGINILFMALRSVFFYFFAGVLFYVTTCRCLLHFYYKVKAFVQ